MADTTVAATAGSTLPEDVILEILARLEEASAVFRCAATCRRWRSLAAETSFHRGLSLWPDRSFVGFFTNEWCRGEGVSLVPGPRSAFGAGRRLLLRSYIPHAPDAPDVSDWVVPLASHHSLLLVRLFTRDSTTMQLAVCDPLAGTWNVLPTLTLRLNEDCYCLGYAIITGADCCSSSPPTDSSSFRVLLVRTLEYVDRHILHAYSSGQPRWSAPIKFPDHVEHSLEGSTIAHADAAVCRGGVAHWLFTKSRNHHILRVDSQTGRIASTQLLSPQIPKRNLHNRIRLTTTADATLLSLCTHDLRRIQILEQEHTGEDGTVRWLRTKVFKLRLRLEGARCMCLGARSRMMLMMDHHQRVYVLDLKSGAMEEMKDEFYDPNLVAVPMEVDWPNFFMSRFRLV